MDAKTEDVIKSNQMTGMCMDPRALLDMYARYEQCEAALYAELAQTAPTPCLQRMIALMAAEEANQAAAVAAVAAAYGLAPVAPAVPGDPPPTIHPPIMPPYFYAVGEKKDK